jgi:hypothetical protein
MCKPKLFKFCAVIQWLGHATGEVSAAVCIMV